jgi:RNA-binding protein
MLMMLLTENQKKHLRRLGHVLKPVVMLGQHGLTPGVVGETLRALEDHELVKVRARVGDREARDTALDALARQCGAEIVQRIGNMALLYKKNSTLEKILLPDS